MTNKSLFTIDSSKIKINDNKNYHPFQQRKSGFQLNTNSNLMDNYYKKASAM